MAPDIETCSGVGRLGTTFFPSGFTLVAMRLSGVVSQTCPNKQKVLNAMASSDAPGFALELRAPFFLFFRAMLLKQWRCSLQSRLVRRV